MLGEREVAARCASRPSEQVLAAVEFADASPEPPLDTLYENLYVVGDRRSGWYAVDERSPEPHRGEREDERCRRAARELAEAGAAYAGQQPAPGRRSGHGPVEDADDAPRRPSEAEAETTRSARPRTALMADAADARGAARRDGGGDARATSRSS